MLPPPANAVYIKEPNENISAISRLRKRLNKIGILQERDLGGDGTQYDLAHPPPPQRIDSAIECTMCKSKKRLKGKPQKAFYECFSCFHYLCFKCF